MKASNKHLLRRAVWYLVGFALLYAPFALVQRLLTSVFKVNGSSDSHGACFRMAVQGIFTGKGIDILTTSGIIILLVLGAALIAGPFFCGKLCMAGAIPEYLSRAVPDRLKLNWQKNIHPTPVRYGILAGFLITPALGLSVACAYCNYALMEKFILGGITWDLWIISSTTLITAFIWLVVLGAFAKGGRGYCSYLCPIGAFQSLLHSVGAKVGFTYKLKYSASKCVSCNICVKDCPMGALQSSDDGLKYNIHNCITCRQCEQVCPKAAITYGQGEGCWNNSNQEKVETKSSNEIFNKKNSIKILIASTILIVVLGILMISRGLALSGMSPSAPGVSAIIDRGQNLAIIQGDSQTATIKITSNSYAPIVVQKGIPVKWIIQADAEDINDCNNEIIIPKLKIDKKLAAGDNLIELPPLEVGEIQYTCWMNMIKSKITVVDDLGKL